MAILRILTDSQRATLGYGGPAVAVDIGLSVDDIKRDIHCPSGNALAAYKQEFRTDVDFIQFVQDVILKSTGSALDGRLAWRT